MAQGNCEKCNEAAGASYRFYYGKLLGRDVRRSDFNKIQIKENYEISGHKDTLLCDRCVTRDRTLWSLFWLAPAFFPFFVAMLPFTKSEPWNETDYIAFKICLTVGLSWIVTWALLRWLVLKFGDRQVMGEKAAAHFSFDKGLRRQGYDRYWLAKYHEGSRIESEEREKAGKWLAISIVGAVAVVIVLTVSLIGVFFDSTKPKLRPQVRLLYDAFEVGGKPRTFQYEASSSTSEDRRREREGADLISIVGATNQVLRYAGLELARDKDQPYTATLRVTGKAKRIDGGDVVTATIALELPDDRSFSKKVQSAELNNAYSGREDWFDIYGDFAPVLAELVGRAYGSEALLSMLSGTLPNDGEQTRPVYLRVTIDPDDAAKLRVVAANALGNIGDERAVDPLIEILNDPEWDPKSNVQRLQILREAAIIAVGKIRNPRAIPAIIEVLKRDRGFTHRDDAVIALGRMKDPRAVPLLVAAFQESHYEVKRRDMAETLKEFTGQDFGIWGDASEKWRQWLEKNKQRYPSQ